MDFKPEFFEDEIRRGFYVPTMLKRGWAASMEVLEDIDRICKKYGLTYYAHLGTLIGAIRHGGFIPWDDDIDICMKRADYMRFLEVAEKELPDNYALFNVFKKDRHDASLCGVLNTVSVRTDSEFLEKYHGCSAIVGVDIFVLDYLPRDMEQQEQFAEALDFVYSLIAQYDELTLEQQLKQLSLVKEILGVEISVSDPERTPTFQLGQLLEQLCMLYGEEDADEITNIMTWQGARDRHFKKEWFDSVEHRDFEGFQMPIPVGYDGYLSVVYGDYMTEYRHGAAHAFPHFLDGYYAGRREMGLPIYVPTFLPLPRPEVDKANKEVLFITMGEKWWHDMDWAFKKVRSENPDANIKVMNIPYYVKNYVGDGVEKVYDPIMLPGVTMVDCEEYDLQMGHPDVIYFQAPWNEYHEMYEVESKYYVENLQAASDYLVYVPVGQMPVLDEDDGCGLKMLLHGCNYPGTYVADRIEVSDAKKANYLMALGGYTGDESLLIWAKKFNLNIEA